MNSKQLKLKTNLFLSARTQKQPLLDIIKHFEVILIAKTNRMIKSLLVKVRLSLGYFFLSLFVTTMISFLRIIYSENDHVERHSIVAFFFSSFRQALQIMNRQLHRAYCQSSKYSPKSLEIAK